MNHCTAGPGKGYYFPAPAYETAFLLAKGQEALLAREVAKLGDVWELPKGKAWRGESGIKHPATFPVELAARCLAATLAEGAVLDPFAGTGTTGVAAAQEGRDAVLIERSPEYCRVMGERLESDLKIG